MSTTLPEPTRTDETFAPPPPRRTGRGGLVLGGLLVVGGLLWLLEAVGVDVPWDAVLPAGLIVVGGALMVGAGRGHHGGLIALGVVLTVFAGAAAAIDGPLSLGIGERVITPAHASDLEPDYGLGMGSLQIDLRDTTFPAGSTQLAVRVAMGELIVRVPDDLRVVVDAHAVGGDIQAFDREESGLDATIDQVTFGPESGRTLWLTARVGFGSVEVRP
jgi:hypothetical protein